MKTSSSSTRPTERTQLALRALAAVEQQPVAAAADQRGGQAAAGGGRRAGGAEEEDVEVHAAPYLGSGRDAASSSTSSKRAPPSTRASPIVCRGRAAPLGRAAGIEDLEAARAPRAAGCASGRRRPRPRVAGSARACARAGPRRGPGVVDHRDPRAVGVHDPLGGQQRAARRVDVAVDADDRRADRLELRSTSARRRSRPRGGGGRPRGSARRRRRAGAARPAACGCPR